MATGGSGYAVHSAATGMQVGSGDSQGVQPAPTYGEVYKSRVWEDLSKLFQQDQLTDVMLVADGQSIPCHKVLLAAASKFFHAKFVTNLNTLGQNLVDVEGVDFDTLTLAVSFIYNGQIDLTPMKAQKLLPASVSLMLPELTGICQEFLVDKMDPKLADVTFTIDIYRMAKANGLTDIEDESWGVMLEKFQDIKETDSFKELSDTELLEYISDDGLNVSNDNPVFEAVVNWVRHDVDNRKARFKNLMNCVTLLHCSLDFLRDTVRTEPLMKIWECYEDLADVLCQQAESTSLQRGKARRGFTGGRNLPNTLVAACDNEIYILRDRESNWTNRPNRAVKRLEFSSACLKVNGILISGGKSNQSLSRQCWALSLPSLNTMAVCDLNVSRRLHASVCVGGHVYVLGGYQDGGKRLRSVEYLDEKVGLWHVASDMPVALSSHTAVAYRHFIYVIGGFSEKDFSKATFVLDTVNKKWSRKADMPESRAGTSSVLYREKIYVMGGYPKCSAMSYDPAQDQWKIHSAPKVEHSGGCAVTWKDKILLCGGTDTSVIEEYNPYADNWALWKHPLPKGVKYPSVFAVRI